MPGLEKLLHEEKNRLEREAIETRARISADESRLRHIDESLLHINALLDQDEAAPAEPRTLKAASERSVLDLAADILAEREREPMYYKDLAKEVQARGGALGGTTPAQTLVARLVNDPRFVRPTRKGFYALRGDYPNARNIGARKNRRRSS